MDKEVVLIGYSGHAYVAAEILLAAGLTPAYYCEREEKKLNPYNLRFLGTEQESISSLKTYKCFIAIGENQIRRKIADFLTQHNVILTNAVHPSAIVSTTASIDQGVMIGAGTIINAQAVIGQGVICNTACIVEHECRVGSFVHIAPGAVLCGDVTIGDNSFIGANSVIRQGVRIGRNVTVGAGAVVLADVPDNTVTIGNPSKSI